MDFTELPVDVQIIAARALADKLSPSSVVAEGNGGSGPAKALAREVRGAFIELYSPAGSASTPHDNDSSGG